jgi:hypothetical protein
VLAVWHRPLFSSSMHGDNPDTRPLYRALYDAGADVIVNGHDHVYERFAPQDPNGRRDDARGIREFVVGTGGTPLYDFQALKPNNEARAQTWGVLQLDLTESAYSWQFIAAGSRMPVDAGSALCH